MPQLRALIVERPEAFGDQGDPAYHAEQSLLRSFCGKNLLARELMARELDRLAADLAGPEPTALERLLGRRAALCWLAVHQYETTYARDAPDLTLGQSDCQQRRIDRAHRRLLSALRTLAAVRRVPTAAVQVNVQTVNVETPPPAADEAPAPGLMDLLGSRAPATN